MFVRDCGRAEYAMGKAEGVPLKAVAQRTYDITERNRGAMLIASTQRTLRSVNG
jgi:hypothetical protein